MKQLNVFVKKGMMIVAAAGFFGLLYPELCVLKDTCKVIYINDEGKEEEEVLLTGSELYYKLLSATPKEITIKSRLLELISDYLKER